ncbi:hypothetical protein CTE05_11320 [Cellulomonas terrae]|uniref:SnoaL-like domain-containing protein n=1 Tax=Cellulomonas terrae TaxID=311234 RepID=A0A511JI23_9CELL|nr:hypothetical protein CTE05_11320 [Cellulomonas terrae]
MWVRCVAGTDEVRLAHRPATVVTHRLEGDFPGGVVVLDCRFTLADEVMVSLVIAP